jgi:hypothetical protein
VFLDNQQRPGTVRLQSVDEPSSVDFAGLRVPLSRPGEDYSDNVFELPLLIEPQPVNVWAWVAGAAGIFALVILYKGRK